VLVTVVIPTLNEAQNIEACIAAARCGGERATCYAPTEVEIIVADGGSHDGTLDLVPAGAATTLMAPQGRAVQMNRGAAAAQGEILIFCHGDTRLPPGWREAVVEALARPGVSGGAFQIRYVPARGILHLVNHWRFLPRWDAIHGDRAQFMTRATFDEIGGFREIPLMEDVEMARDLHGLGRLVLLPQRVTASSRRYLELGPLRQYALSVWCMICYRWLGASPEQIAHIYRSSREAGVHAQRTL
jgi:rSAM/selenodomain-associated transferase 2